MAASARRVNANISDALKSDYVKYGKGLNYYPLGLQLNTARVQYLMHTYDGC